MYILECGNNKYYTGSTKDLTLRVWEHQNQLGANYTKKYQPVKLVYFEEFSRIEEAFYREKQIQGWSHSKKKGLINKNSEKLHELAECKNESHFRNKVVSTPLNDRVNRLLKEIQSCPQSSFTERSRSEGAGV